MLLASTIDYYCRFLPASITVMMAIGCYVLLLQVALSIISMAIGCSALLLLVAISIRHYH